GAAMVAGAGPDVDGLGTLAGEMQRGGHVADTRLVALAAEHAMDLDVLVPELALLAMEGDLEAFPRRIGAERVVEEHAVGVGRLHLHSVFDRDVVSPHAAVPVVAIDGLGLEVHLAQVLVRLEIEMVVAAVEHRTAMAAWPVVLQPEVGSGLWGVKDTLAIGGDGLRSGGDPPVHEVEMMGGLVHQQAARAILVTVPAAEVVGAVHAIEIPGEIDRLDLADRPGHQDVLELRTGRRVAIVEGNRELLATRSLCIEHLPELAEVDG